MKKSPFTVTAIWSERMSEDIFRRYPVNLSDSVRIDYWMKKYGLTEEEKPQPRSFHQESVKAVSKEAAIDWYQFSEREKRMSIPKKESRSCLFPPELQNDSYISIANSTYNNLNKLYRYVVKCDEKIKKIFAPLFKNVKKAVDKIAKGIDEKEDEEKSSFCTETYVNAISFDIQKIMELCLLKTDDCWKQIGQLMVDYLEQLGFYVPERIENSAKSDYISSSGSYPELAQNAAMHGKIHYFHCLPYVIDYYDDLDEICHRVMGGICTYYQYEKVKR